MIRIDDMRIIHDKVGARIGVSEKCPQVLWPFTASLLATFKLEFISLLTPTEAKHGLHSLRNHNRDKVLLAPPPINEPSRLILSITMDVLEGREARIGCSGCSGYVESAVCGGAAVDSARQDDISQNIRGVGGRIEQDLILVDFERVTAGFCTIVAVAAKLLECHLRSAGQERGGRGKRREGKEREDHGGEMHGCCFGANY
jgi:hypothetical protein